MAVSTAEIKKLRDQTGAGMMDAKRALEEAGGDRVQALQILRQKGQAKAAKRAERAASAGLIEAYVHQGRVGTLVEVNCETDFVARTDDFKTFVRDVAMQVAAAAPQYLSPEDIPAAALAAEKAVYEPELKAKPAEISEKILAGKLDKWYGAVCLLRQPFIKDPDKTVGDYQTELIAKLGENIVIKGFKRLALGEEAA